ncbi:MAG TPA: endonuclease V, partial [Candidatus Ozemobacteraceae bacterium]|nr:endonuclease V [Candidatus Ozemobacteraceae bacterium]
MSTSIHEWPDSLDKAREIQEQLRSRVCLTDDSRPIRFVAGIDCSAAFWSHDLWATIIVIDRNTGQLADRATAFGRAPFPYVPGFLTFREGPLVVEAFSRLTVVPDLLVFDGQGIAHPRGLGLAAHLGVWFDLPSIGCAKTHFFGDYAEPDPEPGDFSPLLDGERLIGAVLRTRRRARPVFISPGHRVSVDGARNLVWSFCAGYRLPEPTR